MDELTELKEVVKEMNEKVGRLELAIGKLLSTLEERCVNREARISALETRLWMILVPVCLCLLGMAGKVAFSK